MTCQECIAQANEFIDETLDALERARHEAHLERCPACARYHRVLRNGLQLVRDVDEVRPSAGFAIRLHGRLRGLEEERVRRERAVLSGASLVIVVAGLIALAAWAPVWQDGTATRATASEQVRQAPIAELPPVPAAARNPWWYGGPGGESSIPVVTRAATFPGPYSPLVVQPPIGGAAGRSAALSIGE